MFKSGQDKNVFQHTWLLKFSGSHFYVRLFWDVTSHAVPFLSVVSESARGVSGG